MTYDIKKYLASKGWYNTIDSQWIDLNSKCKTEYHESIAYVIQQYRDDRPWYKRIMRKLFFHRRYR